MSVNELKKSAVEINAIFENLSIELSEKIPQHIKEFFQQIASETYDFEYDKTKKLNEQKIMPKTKGILALLYRDYICNVEEKKIFLEAYNEYFMKKNQNIPSTLNTKHSDTTNQIAPIIVQKEKWYTKLLNFMKKTFKNT